MISSGDVMGYFEDIQRVVRMIPQGKVATYGQVARAAGYPGAARQVAWALRDSDARRLPWHRVLGQGGKILLPGEAGLHQRTLLEVEGVRFRGARVDLDRSEFLFAKKPPNRK
jgi:methylated-DNA-protein-cysteine methyltransferase-like protein